MKKTLTVREWLTKRPNEVIEIIKTAKSYNDILLQLGAQPTNTSARKSIKSFIQDNNLEEPNYNVNFRNLSAEKRARTSKEQAMKLFTKGTKYLGSKLRHLVLLYDLIPYVCATESCILSERDNIIWNGQKLTLDLDHINGDNLDNRLENLRFLCPNCHSQTDTYKGKNQKTNRRADRLPVSAGTYEQQQAKFESLPSAEELRIIVADAFSKAEVANKYGVTTYALNLRLQDKPYKRLIKKSSSTSIKTSWGTPSEVIALVEKLGWESTGRTYGVSGNAVRKYLTNNDVDITQVSTPHNSGRKKAV